MRVLNLFIWIMLLNLSFILSIESYESTISNDLIEDTEEFSNPPLPPENFLGKQVYNKILNRTFIANLLLWTTSSDPSVIGYYLYRNGELIAVIPATDPLIYEDNNRKKKFGDIYHITSINQDGLQSIPLILTLPN